ncbi:MAG: hypothetical protein Q8Q48_02330 [Candidatus Staskawiczbacteria bacterium]|nr:hypothetical protein [Candidatus Staskawiczbacteria bacterium]
MEPYKDINTTTKETTAGFDLPDAFRKIKEERGGETADLTPPSNQYSSIGRTWPDLVSQYTGSLNIYIIVALLIFLVAITVGHFTGRDLLWVVVIVIIMMLIIYITNWLKVLNKN